MLLQITWCSHNLVITTEEPPFTMPQLPLFYEITLPLNLPYFLTSYSSFTLRISIGPLITRNFRNLEVLIYPKSDYNPHDFHCFSVRSYQDVTVVTRPLLSFILLPILSEFAAFILLPSVERIAVSGHAFYPAKTVRKISIHIIFSLA